MGDFCLVDSRVVKADRKVGREREREKGKMPSKGPLVRLKPMLLHSSHVAYGLLLTH